MPYLFLNIFLYSTKIRNKIKEKTTVAALKKQLSLLGAKVTGKKDVSQQRYDQWSPYQNQNIRNKEHFLSNLL